MISSASACGKTTVGRDLAGRLGVPFVELDAIHHRAGWNELPAAEFRTIVEPLVAQEAWVIDGGYRGKIGDLVLARADTVVWLDLPRRVWLPRLLRRTVRRLVDARGALERQPRDAARRVLGSRRADPVLRCARFRAGGAVTRSSWRDFRWSACVRPARCGSFLASVTESLR